MREVVLVQEAYQERRMARLPRPDYEPEDVRFVVWSQSIIFGKTTFSHRLSIQLGVNGLKPHPIAVDNILSMGTYSENSDKLWFWVFEANIPNLMKIWGSLKEEVYLPFDFKSGKRKYMNLNRKTGSQDILVIEGIHCLNQIDRDNGRCEQI